MSPAERQAARRQRLARQVADLQCVVADQQREIAALRRSLREDEEYQTTVQNIVGEGDIAAGLRDMRLQLLDGLHLATTTITAMRRIKGPMYEFAVGGKSMDRETRKVVFKELTEIDDAARVAYKSFVPEVDNPPPWTLGLYQWKQP
jgi:hypothetical protein